MDAAAKALCGMGVAALFVAVVAIVSAEVLAGRADRRYAQSLRESGLRAEVRDIQLRADCERTRALADRAFEAAERQRCRMPSREQVFAAAGDGAHDWLGVPAEDRALEIALLESEFRRESRPPVAADTDPGAATAW